MNELPTNFDLSQIQYSNRFLGWFRSARNPNGNDIPTPKRSQSELEPPFRRIFYNVEGDLSKGTELDYDVANSFMRVSDMRRNIFVITADVLPEQNGSKKPSLYTLLREENRFVVKINERQIEDLIRSSSSANTTDYDEQRVRLLNRSLNDALSKALFHEKLGIYDEDIPYFGYTAAVLYFGFKILTAEDPTYELLRGIAYYTLLGQPFFNSMATLITRGDKGKPWMRGDLKECILPILPVDRWIRGRLFLAQFGDSLVVRKDTSPYGETGH